MVDGFRAIRIVLLTAIFTSLWSFALTSKAQEENYPQPFKASSAPPFDEGMNEIAGEAVRVLVRAVTDKIDTSEDTMSFVLLPYEQGQEDLKSLSFKGQFTGVTAQGIPNFEGKQLSLTTTFTIHTQQANDKEVQIDVNAEGKVASAADFISFFPAVAMPKCFSFAENAADESMKAYSLKLCESLDASLLSGSPSQIAAQMLGNWKNTLLAELQLAYEKNPENFKGAYEQVIEVINQGIVIIEETGATSIELHLKDLNEKLSEHFSDFFEKTKLDIIFIDTFRLTIADDVVEFNFNLSIYQPQNRVNLGMGFLTSTYENTPSTKRAGYFIGLGAAEFLERKGAIGEHNATATIVKDGANAAKNAVKNTATSIYNNALDALTGGGSED